MDGGVGWIAAIIIGGIAGWLAEQFMKSDMGLLMNIDAWHRRGGDCQRYFERVWDRSWRMVGLPNCRLHRRVLADLDRPAGKGDTDSLRTDSWPVGSKAMDHEAPRVHHLARGRSGVAADGARAATGAAGDRLSPH